jgi:hypothetical protein
MGRRFGAHSQTREHRTSGIEPMPNSRVCISIAGFSSGFMLIWLLISWTGLGPADASAAGSFRVAYLLAMLVLFSCFWVYFFRRPRGGKTLLDGRTALSGSAFIVGVATGYAFIELELIVSRTVSGHSAGGFAIFIGCTLVPIMAWLVVAINSLYQRSAALRSESQT